jgi:hypothetical protein
MFEDPNRNLGPSDPYLNRYSDMSDGSGYGPIIALVAIALVVGGLFFFAPSNDQTQVATNNPAVTRTAPAPAMPAPPPKAPTAPQQ